MFFVASVRDQNIRRSTIVPIIRCRIIRICVLSYCKALIDCFNQESFEDRELEHFDKDGNVKWVDYKRMANR